MAKKQTYIQAQHSTRKDKNGNPATKLFTQEGWNNIPGVDYMDKDGRTKQVKGGWVQVGTTSKTPPPTRLKQKPAVTPAQPVAKAEPVAPAPADVIDTDATN